MLYNVLVVDDDKRTAEGLAQMISVLGHTVGMAYGPRMALQRLNEVIPDVIFLDVNMPGVDGIEVLRYLRRDPYTAKVPVVIVSANDADSDREQALSAGANHYIVKPPTMDQIEHALAKVVNGAANDGTTGHSAPGKSSGSQDSDPPKHTPPFTTDIF